MATAAQLRTIALALDGVTEIDHFGRPAFRTKTRIFAVIRPDGLWLYLPPERKEFLFEADPQAFVRYMWGKTAELLVQTDQIDRNHLKALVAEAWEAAQPRQKRVSLRTNR